jgi:putative ABC transport system permease protein
LMGRQVAERLQPKTRDALELTSSTARSGSEIMTGAASEALNLASDKGGARQPVKGPLASAAAEPQVFTIAGLVSSGGPEDNQVFVPLGALQQLMGLSGKVSLVEMRLPGTPGEADAEVRDLSRAFPSVEVRPVREIMQSEGRVLGTMQALLLALAALIVGVVVLCVMATVTTILLDRRKEVAVMKALGASDRAVFALLLAEIAALGIAGGLVGFAAGALLARRLGVDLFGVPLNTDWGTALPVLVATVLAAALPALLPVSTVRSIDPARALKGE